MRYDETTWQDLERARNGGAPMWISDYCFADGKPFIALDFTAPASPRRLYWSCLNDTVDLVRLKGRRCNGPYSLADLRGAPCQLSNVVPPGQAKCRICKAATGFSPFFYNLRREQLSPSQARYNLEPHVVYMGSFGTNCVKVGTTNARRTEHRMLEQGVLAGALIARARDAYEARLIERRLSSLVGIAESVRASQKRRQLIRNRRASEETARAALQEGLVRAAPYLDVDVGNLQILRYGSCYGVIDGDAPIRDMHGTRPVHLKGVIRAMVGQQIIVEHPGRELRIFDIAELLGHRVELGRLTTSEAPFDSQGRLF